MRVILFALIVSASLLGGCSKKKEGGEAGSSKPAETKPAEVKPEAVAPAQPAAAALDLCAMLPKEEVEKAMGAKVVGEPTKTEAKGSFLGDCTYETEKDRVVLSARPADEFDATARGGTDVAGVGEAAKMTTSGLLVKVAGKPYFLHVMTMAGTTMDNAKAADIAKIAVANAK